MSSGTLAGRTVVVTGGSMGIGLACAEEVLARGARVVVCARGKDELTSAAADLEKRFPKAVKAVRADIAEQRDVEKVMDAARDFGGVHGVIHSAGIYGPIGPVTQVDPDKWFDAIRVNLFGSFLVAREAARRMTADGARGSIVLMSGGGAATPFPNYTAYACGKVGVVRLTETLAQELAGTQIRVNCIAPGFVATRLHNQTLEAGREAAGDFIDKTRQVMEKGGVPPTVAANAAAFLLEDRSSGITGRFLAAPYDGYDKWPEHADAIRGSDFFTLRRIVPKDRGQDWQ